MACMSWAISWEEVKDLELWGRKNTGYLELNGLLDRNLENTAERNSDSGVLTCKVSEGKFEQPLTAL